MINLTDEQLHRVIMELAAPIPVEQRCSTPVSPKRKGHGDDRRVDDLDRQIDQAVREVMSHHEHFVGPGPGGTRKNIALVVRVAIPKGIALGRKLDPVR
jgi:hypothetical protein